jgi:hypothetical protein
MLSQEKKPKWWQLYLTFPLLITLFVMDNRLKISSRGHQIFQIGIVLLVYACVHSWLKANSKVLSKLDQRNYQRTVRVIRIPEYQFSELDGDKRPLFQLPDSEIKGVLGDTFEMNYIDAESFPVNTVSEESNKE